MAETATTSKLGTTRSAPMPRLDSLTSIRFFAALWVVLFHVSSWSHPQLFSPVIGVGYAGVSLFFVLSGFILTYTYLPRPFATSHYCHARIARVLPVYLLGLIISLPYFIHDTRSGAIPLAGSVISTITLTQAWIPRCAMAWNAPGWSLSCEFFSYLLFPFALSAAANWFRRSPRFALASVWIVSAMPVAAYLWFRPDGPVDLSSTDTWISVVKFNPIVRLPEFLIGIFLGTAFVDGVRLPRPRLLLALATAGFLASLYAGRDLPYPIFHDSLLVPFFGLMIFALACDGRAISHPWLVLLGEASYCLYILHATVLRAVLSTTKYGFHRRTDSGWLALFSILLAIAVALLAYRWIELPSRRYVLTRFRDSEAQRN